MREYNISVGTSRQSAKWAAQTISLEKLKEKLENPVVLELTQAQYRALSKADRDAAKEAGVPSEDIFCDHAGFSTYDSMYRAGSIFGAERVIVVTQEYHQYRALYIGKKLGLTVCGAASDQRDYFGETYREMREMLARFKDVFKALMHSKPALGGDARQISGSGLVSHGE